MTVSWKPCRSVYDSFQLEKFNKTCRQLQAKLSSQSFLKTGSFQCGAVDEVTLLKACLHGNTDPSESKF